jgi:hypothetical protein
MIPKKKNFLVEYFLKNIFKKKNFARSSFFLQKIFEKVSREVLKINPQFLKF